jgi:hypothetical protein
MIRSFIKQTVRKSTVHVLETMQTWNGYILEGISDGLSDFRRSELAMLAVPEPIPDDGYLTPEDKTILEIIRVTREGTVAEKITILEAFMTTLDLTLSPDTVLGLLTKRTTTASAQMVYPSTSDIWAEMTRKLTARDHKVLAALHPDPSFTTTRLRNGCGQASFMNPTVVREIMIGGLLLWYGDTYCADISANQVISHATADWVQSLFRGVYGVLVLKPMGNGFVFDMMEGEGVQGYHALGCHVVLSNSLEVESVRFGAGDIIQKEKFTPEIIMRVASNIVCALAYLHFGTNHVCYADNLLYAFYRQPGADVHPLRKVIDTAATGVASATERAVMTTSNTNRTMFGNATKQTVDADMRLLQNTLAQKSPVEWSTYVKRFDSMSDRPSIIADLDIWYHAFEVLVTSMCSRLDIRIDPVTSGWLNTIGRDATMCELSRTITELYFNNVIHELTGGPDIAELLKTSYSAIRIGQHHPTMVQYIAVRILHTGLSVSGTIRFNDVDTHPWSRIGNMCNIVATFQKSIAAISEASAIHPSKVETYVTY